MDNQKMGQFISELRKSKKLTQKDLATKLNITDKAVSKWERGLSTPDISLLVPIAEILGVTTCELLNGEKNSSENSGDYAEESVDNAITNAISYAKKTEKVKLKSIRNVFAVVFTAVLLIGIAVCVICNLAVAGKFTWSLYPISSIVFAWLVFFPVIKFEKHGVVTSITALSLLIIPFLAVLDCLVTSTDLILPLGIKVSVICVVYLWVIFAVFKKLKNNKLTATAVSVFFAIPVQLIIDFAVSKSISEPNDILYDVIAIFALAITSGIFYLAGKRNTKDIGEIGR